MTGFWMGLMAGGSLGILVMAFLCSRGKSADPTFTIWADQQDAETTREVERLIAESRGRVRP